MRMYLNVEVIILCFTGKALKLSPGAEEVATFYAKMLDHEYTTKDIFKKNFFKDWRKVTHFSKHYFSNIIAIILFTIASFKGIVLSADGNVQKFENVIILIETLSQCLIETLSHKCFL